MKRNISYLLIRPFDPTHVHDWIVMNYPGK